MRPTHFRACSTNRLYFGGVLPTCCRASTLPFASTLTRNTIVTGSRRNAIVSEVMLSASQFGVRRAGSGASTSHDSGTLDAVACGFGCAGGRIRVSAEQPTRRAPIPIHGRMRVIARRPTVALEPRDPQGDSTKLRHSRRGERRLEALSYAAVLPCEPRLRRIGQLISELVHLFKHALHDCLHRPFRLSPSDQPCSVVGRVREKLVDPTPQIIIMFMLKIAHAHSRNLEPSGSVPDADVACCQDVRVPRFLRCRFEEVEDVTDMQKTRLR